MPEPMSDEDLVEIKLRLNKHILFPREPLDRLINEVERLREENEMWRDLVHWLRVEGRLGPTAPDNMAPEKREQLIEAVRQA